MTRTWIPPTTPRKSATFDDYTLSEIRRAAADRHLRYPRRRRQAQAAAFRRPAVSRRSISRYPLEGYREKCGTNVVLGSRFAKKPIELKIPITIAGMSFGSLSGPGQGSAGTWRDARRHLDDHRRRRHDAGRARPVEDAGLSVPAVALWHEPATTCARPTRSRSSSARAPSPAAAACCSARRSPTASPRCARCRRASTSARPAGIRTGPGPTISRSRSTSSARSPIGKSRSM